VQTFRLGRVLSFRLLSITLRPPDPLPPDER